MADGTQDNVAITARTTNFDVEDTMTISIKQPLWAVGALVLGLVTTAGPALAQTLDCDEGIIQGTQGEDLVVDEIIIDGRSCVVAYVAVTGDVLVTNSEDFILADSLVLGDVSVTNGRNVTLVSNDIGERQSSGPSELLVKDNENAVVLLNSASGSIKVNYNARAVVVANLSPVINCKNNGRLEARGNEAEGGDCLE